MAGIGYLHDHGVNHGQVQADRHAVIQEAGVGHLTLAVKEVFFVQGPPDTLGRTSLHLSFHVAGMNCFPAILNRRVAQYVHLARVLVHLHIYNVNRE